MTRQDQLRARGVFAPGQVRLSTQDRPYEVIIDRVAAAGTAGSSRARRTAQRRTQASPV
ncbi:hypothetical protein [Kribbella capetownensis]|uniref:hypothetical protein n=1 Tax=Kribbella capetownensis TaxID=1572659 RepID=UPI0013F403EF|nr:hypothetical protein [Kribbella capetownensis]